MSTSHKNPFNYYASTKILSKDSIQKKADTLAKDMMSRVGII
jgi:hypothetical protein